MDISYLLMLQDFRATINDALTPFLEWISHFTVNNFILLPVFIYWVLDKKKGLYIFASAAAGLAVNSLIKLTVCAYRPWIRDSAIIPAGDAITEATGYSFPSGHTVCATTIAGGTGVSYGREKKWIGAICIAFILIVGFSRNYLGVHTPQDVVVGLILGTAVLFGMQKLFKYLEEHPEKEDLCLIIGVAVAVLALIYISFKPYPMDYVDGKLLVDPKRMMKDGYSDMGLLPFLCVGRFLEKRFVKFKSTGLKAKGIGLFALGAVPMYIINKVLGPILVDVLGSHFGSFFTRGLLAIFVVLLWPMLLKLLVPEARENET